MPAVTRMNSALKGPNPIHHPTAWRLANDVLAPIAEWCQMERGRRAQFIRTLKHIATPEFIADDTIGYWIHASPVKRKQPSLGHGILIIQAAKALQIRIHHPFT